MCGGGRSDQRQQLAHGFSPWVPGVPMRTVGVRMCDNRAPG
ncbi:hypothetical protein STXM2123_4931 [Streptomyces sp. F-3]|nr:hypothetical protein STXM2123_4931 [Streptomyces sp. F-3]